MTNLKTRKRVVLYSYPPLPEIKFCWMVVIGAILYGWMRVYQASQQFKWQFGDLARVNQLPLIGQRFKDESNWEWNNWSPRAFSYLPIFIAHTLFFNIGSKFLSESVFVPLYTLASMAVCAWNYSPTLVAFSIVAGLFICTVSYYLPNRKAVWLSFLPFLYLTMHEPEKLHSDVFSVLVYVSYTLLSYISFAIETLKGPIRSQDAPFHKRILRMFFYTYYQPYLVSLIVLYPDFERQIAEREKLARDWPATIKMGIRIAFWWTLIEFILHFFYFEAMLKRLDFSAAISKDSFVAMGMTLGLFFHLKYVVIFGFPSFFAKLDNMQPLQGPMCLARAALYSQVWRSFDRGLYNFFKKYIFIPICAPDFSLTKKIFGVFISYGFVLIWHGMHHNNIVWICLNIIALFLEMGSKAVYSIEGVRMWREKHISDLTLRRLLGWLQVVPLAFGLYSNFYFLGGSEIGGLFVKRVLEEETYTMRRTAWVLISIGYCYTQVTIEADRWLDSREKKLSIEKKAA